MAGTNISISKRCDMCKIDVDLAQFSKNKSTRDGLAKTCKTCAKEYAKKYYRDNKESFNKAAAANYAANKDAYKARARKWETENIERKRELAAIYRAKNPEKIKEFGKRDWLRHGDRRREYHKNYRLANPERGAEHVRARQTRKQQAMPVWADRDAIRAIYAECRRISDATGIKHHVDHFYPLKNSLVCGLHNQYNLQIIPAAVNQAKGNKIAT